MALDDDDFDDELERLRARRRAAEDALRDAFDRSAAILVTEGDRDELWILSPETHPEEGDVRVTFLSPDGPTGHRSAVGPEDLIAELASFRATYRPVDEGFVIQWTSTPQWEEGVMRVSYVQAVNLLQSLAARHDAREWAWQQILESREEMDFAKAIRMLELAARDLQAGRAPNPLATLKQSLMPPR